MKRIMLKRMAFAVLGLALLSGVARAQELVEDEEVRKEPVRRIKVLQNPYDLASFYRSSQGQGDYFGYEQGQSDSRYPIAGFYRSRQSSYGYAPFWNHGYGYRQRGGRAVIGYRRHIGENGDLFLFAPTFLAPLGPLNGAFGN
jgi:hypothetical protein